MLSSYVIYLRLCKRLGWAHFGGFCWGFRFSAMDKETEENPEGWGAPSRRLAVIRGHLSGSGPSSSAPMSSSKAEVQRAFPRSRYFWMLNFECLLVLLWSCGPSHFLGPRTKKMGVVTSHLLVRTRYLGLLTYKTRPRQGLWNGVCTWVQLTSFS